MKLNWIHSKNESLVGAYFESTSDGHYIPSTIFKDNPYLFYREENGTRFGSPITSYSLESLRNMFINGKDKENKTLEYITIISLISPARFIGHFDLDLCKAIYQNNVLFISNNNSLKNEEQERLDRGFNDRFLSATKYLQKKKPLIEKEPFPSWFSSL